MKRARVLIAGLAMSFLGACGASAPNAAHTDAVAAIRSAQTVGATEEPEASLHLELAREQLADAEDRMERGDNEKARRLLECAQADAELAVALAQYATVRAEAQQTQQRIQDMRDRNL